MKILLIDLTQYGSATTAILLRRYCDVSVIAGIEHLEQRIRAAAPDALCFEFDYPDVPRLAALRQAVEKLDSIPVLMITEYHSEALAVWALRTRVWDYFVKPVPPEELQRCLDDLRGVIATRSAGRRPALGLSPPIPVEVRFSKKSGGARTLQAAVDHVLTHLHENISQGEVAATCRMSPSQFSRAFKQAYGVTFQEFVIDERIKAAAKLLRNASANVAEVGWTVGFHDHSYFTRIFRRHMGITPSNYRAIWLKQATPREESLAG